MSQPDPMPIAYEVRAQLDVDDSHLNVLAICHWVWGGLVMLFGCFGVIYIIMGFAFLNGSIPMPPTTQNSLPNFDKLIAWYFIVFGSIFTGMSWLVGMLTILSGFALRKRRRWMLCIVTAALNCLLVPIGTVLGIFAIIVLARPAVRARFSG